jgi:hypothetical protein
VQPILAAKCGTCHEQGGIAPFSLATYEDAVVHATSIKENVTNRTMPPWMAAPGVRDYRFDSSLSEAQVETIRHWVEAKTPAGDPSEPGTPLATEKIEPIRADATLKLTKPYTPVISPNEYRCFVLDWPYDHTVYITAFDARPGNAAIVHHLQAYLATPSDVPIVEKYDADDPAPGYTCFGAPSPAGAAALPVGMLGGWTPGRGALPLPDGTGIKIERGSKVILQIHYHSTASSDTISDESSLIMTVEEMVANPGHYIPWMNSEWALDPKTMLIPAGSVETKHAYRAKPVDSLVFSVFSGGATFPNGFYIHTVYPHAHKLARTLEAGVMHADGAMEPLVRIPRWDFDWQREYVLAKSTFVAPGDELSIACSWSNTPDDQPFVDGIQLAPHDVTWGEGTEDEMCTVTLYATEKP